MNRQQLLQEIKKILQNKPIDKVSDEGFLYADENKYLLDAYTKNKKSREKWHQIVRFADSDPRDASYMYDRLIRLIIRHKKGIERYFIIKTEFATHALPDRQSDLNRLLILFEEYFAIYRGIMNRIHFDYPSRRYHEPYIRGKIDWNKTLRKSTTKFPLNFETQRWEKDFAVTGNILLILAATWLNKESNILTKINFDEPLTSQEKSIIFSVIENTQKIVNSFAFPEVVSDSKKYSELNFNDKRIQELILNTKNGINEGKIRNKHYQLLLDWLEKFQQLNIRLMTRSTTNFPLDTIENLDTIYEAWIFFEMLDFFQEQDDVIQTQLSEFPFRFDIKSEGKTVSVHYGKIFQKDTSIAWAVKSEPDFCIMSEDQVIIVMDAKNYHETSTGKGDAVHKILAYMANLDTGTGVLFFPNHPTLFESPKNKQSKYYENLRYAQLQLKPTKDEDSLRIKKETMMFLKAEIAYRLDHTKPNPVLEN